MIWILLFLVAGLYSAFLFVMYGDKRESRIGYVLFIAFAVALGVLMLWAAK